MSRTALLTFPTALCAAVWSEATDAALSFITSDDAAAKVIVLATASFVIETCPFRILGLGRTRKE